MSPRRALTVLLAFALAALVGHAWTLAPAPRSASAPPEVFSAARANRHLTAIAQRPRRIGSPDHARVRAYLMAELRSLGLTVEVQERLVDRPHGAATSFAVVRNIVAERRGARGSGQALLLIAHYDTRSMTPGASDDGYGVAALLETLRALGAGSPLANDLLVLISDGEEVGLFGARAFITHHPRARDVGMVINFEARGNSGAAMVFQTSEGNGALIRALAEGAPHVASSSLSHAVYRRMPNDTDLTWWLPRTPALNIANIGGLARYHAPTDTIDNADLGTLQHHGSYALSLARSFGSMPLPPAIEPDAQSFNVGPLFLQHPGTWVMPLSLGAALLLVLFVIAGAVRGSVRPLGALIAFLGAALTAIAAAAVALLGWWLAEAIHPAYAQIHAARPLLWHALLAAFVMIGVAFAMSAQALLSPRVRAAEVFAGTSALFVLLSILAAIHEPGAAFFFTWPALFALFVGLVLAIARGFDSPSPAAFTLAILAPLPAIALLAPFATQLIAAFGPAGAPAPALIVTLLALLAAPAIDLAVGSGRQQAITALGLAAAVFIAANLVPPFDRAYPRPDTLFFAVDADARRAFWLSPDRAPDAWTEAVLSHATMRDAIPLPFPFREGAGILAAEVAAVDEPAPDVAVVEESRTRAGRALRLRVKAPPGAELLAVEVDGDVIRAEVMAVRASLRPRGLSFRFHAPPEAGIEVDLTTSSPEPITVRVVSQRPGFPDKASPQPGLRPPGLMAKPGMMPPWDELLESDMTLVARTFVW